MGWQKLDGSRRCQVHLGSTWQHAARANRFPIRVEEDGRVREPARTDTFPLRGLGTKKSAKQSQFGIDANHWYRRKLNQDRPDRRGENKANSWPVARNSGEWRGNSGQWCRWGEGGTAPTSGLYQIFRDEGVPFWTRNRRSSLRPGSSPMPSSRSRRAWLPGTGSS